MIELLTTAARAGFGNWHLALVYLLCALPVGALVGRAAAQQLQRMHWNRAARVAMAFTGTLLFLAGLYLLSALFAAVEVPFAVGVIARAALCVTLVAGWWPLASLAVHDADGQWLSSNSAVNSTLLSLVTVLLPGAYAWEHCRQCTASAMEALTAGRLRDAQRAIDELTTLGSHNLLGELTPRQAGWLLATEMARLEASLVEESLAEEKLAEDSTADDAPARIDRAGRLAMLGRYDEAADAVSPIAAHDAQAALLLAAIRQRQGQYDHSTEQYRAALALLARPDSRHLESPQHESSQAAADRVRAYAGIAYNAREQRRYAAAEQAYEEGLRQCPQQAADLYFMLGRHYELGGRPHKAIECLREAARLDAATYGQQSALRIEQIRRHTPACLLRGW